MDQAKKHYHLGQQTFYDKVKAASIEGTRTGIYVYYKKTDLDRLFKDKTPKIPAEIRKNYMRSGDALKYYHLGQKRFRRRNAGRRRDQSSDGRQLRLVQERRIGQTLQKDKRQWE